MLGFERLCLCKLHVIGASLLPSIRYNSIFQVTEKFYAEKPKYFAQLCFINENNYTLGNDIIRSPLQNFNDVKIHYIFKTVLQLRIFVSQRHNGETRITLIKKK